MSAHPDDLLSGLVDGELASTDARGVRSHVGSCPACAATLARVRAVRAALRILPAVEPPPGLFGRLVDDGSPLAPVVALRRRRAAPVGA
ncbi:MAG: anti-sigma factor family protein, partial [Acidimicrobiales bacterium]